MLHLEKGILPNQKMISFHLHENDMIELSGKNGSGKTLLLKALAYLYSFPYQTFTFQNKSLDHYQLARYRSEILYFPSRPLLIDGDFEDNLKFPYQFEIYSHKTYNQDSVLKLLDYFEMPQSLLRRKRDQLSNGEEQILNFIRGTLLEPKVYLFDEPTSALDQQRKKLFIDWIVDHKLTGMIVSHDDFKKLRTVSFDSLVHS
jgi:ABC-type iron transport system FetAB ATPase subunit